MIKSFVYALCWVSLFSTATHAFENRVKTEQGVLIGRTALGVHLFKGVPYAAAPVGKLRWKAPEPALPYKTKNAFFRGPECPQASLLTGKSTRGSEDCLTLDIYSKDLKAKKPVMVFIHGGTFMTGNAEGVSVFQIYDSKYLARNKDVVVVSINYRMGGLGFLSLNELDAESSMGTSGNYGLLDQIAALKWIQANIAQFGGDPERVTIFGESAGAASVLLLTSTPLAKGLFQSAIVESGYISEQPKAVQIDRSIRLASALHCIDEATQKVSLECMRSKSSEEILFALSKSSKNQFTPTIDGVVFKQSVLETYKKAEQNKVNLIIGTNTDESAALVHSLYGAEVHNDAELQKTVTAAVNGTAEEADAFWKTVSTRYNSSAFGGNAQTALIQLSTDSIFTCPSRQIARLAAASGQSVYQYAYSHIYQNPFFSKQAAHAYELAEVFHRVSPFLLFNKADRALSETIENAWTGLAHQNAPWPEYDLANETYIELDIPTSVKKHYREENCDLIDRAIVN